MEMAAARRGGAAHQRWGGARVQGAERFSPQVGWRAATSGSSPVGRGAATSAP
uniref:Uncharacterized protein n=1 Tax=Arundo donax TaxID=35708 RepID=A0A0A9GDV5_ARUDO